jgi:hypothetical protein
VVLRAGQFVGIPPERLSPLDPVQKPIISIGDVPAPSAFKNDASHDVLAIFYVQQHFEAASELMTRATRDEF